MIFVIDIGNSHTVLGLYDAALIAQWRVKSDRKMTPDEIAIQLNALFSMSGIDITQIEGAILSSVVPSLEAAWYTCCKKQFSDHLQHDPFIVNNESIRELIAVDIEYPSEVGADRLVNGLAGWIQYRTNMIVIDFGTAITFDCITDKCRYIGGTILPGVAISLEALSLKAAKLPHIDISTKPGGIIGKNTVDAMKSGVLYGYGALIDGFVEILGDEMCRGNGSVNVVATGGMAELIIPYSKKVEQVDRLLTLKGLHYIYTAIYS